MYGSMKAYLSGASIPSAFVERRAFNSETSKPFNIRRSAATAAATTNVCARRSRLCLPHISHACQSKFDLRAPCRAGITKNTDGNPRDSTRPIAVNKPDAKQKAIFAPETEGGGGGRVRARSRFRSTESRDDFHDGSRVVLSAKANLCDSLVATVPDEMDVESRREFSLKSTSKVNYPINREVRASLRPNMNYRI